jgi:hypothetical protein
VLSIACGLVCQVLYPPRTTNLNPEVVIMHVKRDLVSGLTISALALACALAWAGPINTGSTRAQDQAQPQQQPDQEQVKSATFTGIVVKMGDDYVLHDAQGTLYKLDDPNRAKPFENKEVKVTGELDQQAMVIHVVSIEGTDA